MNETILIWGWVISGWIGGLLFAPRRSFRSEPVTASLAVLMFGAYAGPLVLAPRVVRGVGARLAPHRDDA